MDAEVADALVYAAGSWACYGTAHLRAIALVALATASAFYVCEKDEFPGDKVITHSGLKRPHFGGAGQY